MSWKQTIHSSVTMTKVFNVVYYRVYCHLLLMLFVLTILKANNAYIWCVPTLLSCLKLTDLPRNSSHVRPCRTHICPVDGGHARKMTVCCNAAIVATAAAVASVAAATASPHQQQCMLHATSQRFHVLQ
jgi:hypothetical protein